MSGLSVSPSAYGLGPLLKTRQNLPTAGVDATAGVQGLPGSPAGREPAEGAGAAAQAFLDLVSGSPSEKLWKAFLARNDMTEKDFDSLSEKDREALQKAFREEIEAAGRSGSGLPPGSLVDTFA
jgi:hypothetical protein